jgi:hypothetical protein
MALIGRKNRAGTSYPQRGGPAQEGTEVAGQGPDDRRLPSAVILHGDAAGEAVTPGELPLPQVREGPAARLAVGPRRTVPSPPPAWTQWTDWTAVPGTSLREPIGRVPRSAVQGVRSVHGAMAGEVAVARESPHPNASTRRCDGMPRLNAVHQARTPPGNLSDGARGCGTLGGPRFRSWRRPGAGAARSQPAWFFPQRQRRGV